MLESLQLRYLVPIISWECQNHYNVQRYCISASISSNAKRKKDHCRRLYDDICPKRNKHDCIFDACIMISTIVIICIMYIYDCYISYILCNVAKPHPSPHYFRALRFVTKCTRRQLLVISKINNNQDNYFEPSLEMGAKLKVVIINFYFIYYYYLFLLL